MSSGSARLAWVGFPLQTLVDVSEQSRMAAEVMDFDCKMKNTGSTEFSEWGKLELRWNRSVGRAVEASVRRDVGEEVKVSKSKIKVQEDTASTRRHPTSFGDALHASAQDWEEVRRSPAASNGSTSCPGDCWHRPSRP